MVKGRAPCCDKSQVKKGPWSPSEDLRLITFIQKHGHENWRALPKQAGLLRCGKSCRLRWINYLRPDVKRGNFTKEEEETIINLHEALGNKWSKIASYLPGRTDNEIKNVWNTHLKKRLSHNSLDAKATTTHQGNESPVDLSSSCSSSSTASISCGKSIHKVSDEVLEQQSEDHEESKSQKTHEPSEDMLEPDKGNEILSKEPKELSRSLISSDNSNASNYKNLPTLIGSSWELGGTYSEFNDTIQEVNKPNVLEIPFESDTDFWNMLDGLDSLHSDNAQVDLQGMEACPISQVEIGDHKPPVIAKEGDEYGKWFHNMENELSFGDQNYQLQAGVNLTTLMKVEADAVTGGFNTLPPSPNSTSAI